MWAATLTQTWIYCTFTVVNSLFLVLTHNPNAPSPHMPWLQWLFLIILLFFWFLFLILSSSSMLDNIQWVGQSQCRLIQPNRKVGEHTSKERCDYSSEVQEGRVAKVKWLKRKKISGKRSGGGNLAGWGEGKSKGERPEREKGKELARTDKHKAGTIPSELQKGLCFEGFQENLCFDSVMSCWIC